VRDGNCEGWSMVVVVGATGNLSFFSVFGGGGDGLNNCDLLVSVL